MSGPHTDNTIYPSIQETPWTELDPHQLRNHQLTVCAHAYDADDAATILRMLGLIPSPPPVHPQRRKA